MFIYYLRDKSPKCLSGRSLYLKMTLSSFSFRLSWNTSFVHSFVVLNLSKESPPGSQVGLSFLSLKFKVHLAWLICFNCFSPFPKEDGATNIKDIHRCIYIYTDQHICRHTCLYSFSKGIRMVGRCQIAWGHVSLITASGKCSDIRHCASSSGKPNFYQ